MTTLENSTVTYEQLADIEREFEEVETEILRQQYEMSRPLYEKRQALVSQIPNFWALVMEAAPPEIDEHIQPLDSAVLLSSLMSISVRRFEIEDGGKGDPRSVAIRFEFTENDYFEDKVLEKKFWYRYSDDYTGLVSEPVAIQWKEGKDLTDGLLTAVKKVWDEGEGPQQKKVGKGKKERKPLTAAQQALKEKMESMSLGGVSFFAWFGFVGARISAEESKANLEKEREHARLRSEGKEVPKDEEEEEEEEEEEGEDDEFDDDDDLEIFPEGDDLAQAIVLDLWPDALRYFSTLFIASPSPSSPASS
ncbi:hypothetical protein SODALDRAFT_327378 [Sodiomyces alkalinus F11]|uniref:NAP family protein n=1 Tax=Sodiomyces alkalinus (strain CBS 110278 / VKM F-3762 / F11) TaxID=1314773 RepID=A0A3N2Q8U1_SODAK|nr:hypothetical protein SODALDRAFT_327378 [Sodiomyces alkalinus F11]ROT43199.1 hypothetical protein SODALDRAFT_327378 [Sodiomyces alkalinus F11]